MTLEFRNSLKPRDLGHSGIMRRRTGAALLGIADGRACWFRFRGANADSANHLVPQMEFRRGDLWVDVGESYDVGSGVTRLNHESTLLGAILVHEASRVPAMGDVGVVHQLNAGEFSPVACEQGGRVSLIHEGEGTHRFVAVVNATCRRV